MNRQSAIRTWLNCFQPENGWRQRNMEGMPQKLWCRSGKGGTAYFASSCTSTMDLAFAFAEKGEFPEMSWAAAAGQTKGRGQAGRPWDSAAGNLFATIRLPGRALEAGPVLTLAIGLIIADELNNYMPPVLQIKWPNDIIMGGKKAGGILVEERQGRIMAGIGLNVEAVPEAEKNSGYYRMPACSLKEFKCTADAPVLWSAIVRALKQSLMDVLSSPNDLKHRLDHKLAFKDENVILEKGSGENILVRILGLDTTGRLVVEAPGGIEVVTYGRIIPRIMV